MKWQFSYTQYINSLPILHVALCRASTIRQIWVSHFDKGYTYDMIVWEGSGSVVECLSLTVLCPCNERTHNNPSLVLVQPRKTHPYITERLLMGCKK